MLQKWCDLSDLFFLWEISWLWLINRMSKIDSKNDKKKLSRGGVIRAIQIYREI